MRTSKFSESQIVAILHRQEAGLKVADICPEHGISAATFYKVAEQVRRDGRVDAQAGEGAGG